MLERVQTKRDVTPEVQKALEVSEKDSSGRFAQTRPSADAQNEVSKALSLLEAGLERAQSSLPDGLRKAYENDPSPRTLKELRGAELSLVIREEADDSGVKLDTGEASKPSSEDLDNPLGSSSFSLELREDLGFDKPKQTERVRLHASSQRVYMGIGRSGSPSPEANAAFSNGKALLAAGEVEAAQSEFHKAIELDPFNPAYRDALVASTNNIAA